MYISSNRNTWRDESGGGAAAELAFSSPFSSAAASVRQVCARWKGVRQSVKEGHWPTGLRHRDLPLHHDRMPLLRNAPPQGLDLHSRGFAPGPTPHPHCRRGWFRPLSYLPLPNPHCPRRWLRPPSYLPAPHPKCRPAWIRSLSCRPLPNPHCRPCWFRPLSYPPLLNPHSPAIPLSH